MKSTALSGSKPKTESPVGVITGTGVTEHFDTLDPVTVRTEYGEVLVYGEEGRGFFVLPRHGPGHTVPPHRVNYRANVDALRRLGVGGIIATSAVGTMNRRLGVGRLGLVDQFLDFTKARKGTFFDEEVGHADVTNPYSARMNAAIVKAGKSLGVPIVPGLVYVCAEGPRFETAAEIRMFRRLGGDVVGMTGVPEVVLANEAGIEYSSIVVATNWGAGMQKKVSHEEVLEGMKKTGPLVKRLIVESVKALGEGAGT
jgi:5'-methylthioadenosine phosphorylase